MVKVNPMDNPDDTEIKLRETEKEVDAFIASHVNDWILTPPKRPRRARGFIG